MTAGTLEQFEAARPRLFALAYRMLGEATEAEDVVQEAYLRWAKSEPVDTPPAWLTRVATNLCLNRLTSARAHRELVERLLVAALSADLPALEQLLTEDVVSWSDGGGKVTSGRRPVTGREKVLRLLAGFGRHPRAQGVEFAVDTVNGEPALLVFEAGALAGIMLPEIRDGRFAALHNVLNPDKLAFAAAQLAARQGASQR